jgi:hypothetical protein
VPRWEVACLNYQVRAELDSVVEHAVSQRMRPGTFLTKHSATPAKPFSSPSEALRKRTPAINGPRSNNGVRSCGRPSSTQFTAKFSGLPCRECTSSQSIDGSSGGADAPCAVAGLRKPAGGSGFCGLSSAGRLLKTNRAARHEARRPCTTAWCDQISTPAENQLRFTRPKH